MFPVRLRTSFALALVFVMLVAGVLPIGLNVGSDQVLANTVSQYATPATTSSTKTTFVQTVNPNFTIDASFQTAAGSANLTGATVLIGKNLDAGKDSLSYTGTLPSGVTAVNYNSTTGLLRFNGTTTLSNWQTLLRTVTFRSTSTNYSAREIYFTLGSALPFRLDSGEFVYYEKIDGSSRISWSSANTAAAARKAANVIDGYLAVVNSQAKFNFLSTQFNSDEGWLGATDEFATINTARGQNTTTGFANQAASEGRFHWVTGPNKGTLISTGNSPSVTVASGQFTSWAMNEPSNSSISSQNEHYVSMRGSNGWNDRRADDIRYEQTSSTGCGFMWLGPCHGNVNYNPFDYYVEYSSSTRVLTSTATINLQPLKFNQDGFGFSDLTSTYSEITNPTVTMLNTWPGGFTKGASAFVGGVNIGSDVWLIPSSATHLVKVDKATGAMTAYNTWPSGFTKGANAFSGGVYDGTHLWLIPQQADRLIRVNPANGAMTSFNYPQGFYRGTNTFSGGVFDGEFIWLVPRDAYNPVKLNPSNGAMSELRQYPSGTIGASGWNDKFSGGVFDGSHVWMIPYGANHIVKFDVKSSEFTEMTAVNAWPSGFTKGQAAFSGGVYDGANVWLIPYNADRVIKVNASTGVMTGYNSWPVGFTKGNGAFMGGAFDGTNIFMTPHNASTVLKVNTATGIISRVEGITLGSGAPTDLSLNRTTVVDYLRANDKIADISASYPRPDDVLTYSLVSGEGSTDNASFTIVGSELRTNANLNATTKNSYNVRIRVTNLQNQTYEEAFTITVTPYAINNGHYVNFGKYNDQTIKWRVINKDNNGDPLIFADRSIVQKRVFDAPGTAHGSQVHRENGRTIWSSSTLRQWLNSQQVKGTTTTWTGNAPSLTNLCYPYTHYSQNCGAVYPFDTEGGFLATHNFTSAQYQMIKPVLNSYLTANSSSNTVHYDGSWSYSFMDSSGNISSYNATSYNTKTTQTVSDRVFVLTPKMMKEFLHDRGYNNAADNVSYWVNFPTWDNRVWDMGPSSYLNGVATANGSRIGMNYASSDAGVRPAMYLNMLWVNAAGFKSGNGSENDPYSLDPIVAPEDTQHNAKFAGAIYDGQNVFFVPNNYGSILRLQTKPTVVFHSNGGNYVTSQNVVLNGLATAPTPPVRTGHVFEGWYSDELLTTPFDFNTPITASLHLYAKWTASSTAPPTVSNGNSITWNAKSNATHYKVYLNGNLLASNVTTLSYSFVTTDWRMDRLYVAQVSAVVNGVEQALSDAAYVYRPTSGNVRMISSGWQHGLALMADGTIREWGANDRSQLGLPTGLDHVVAVSAGRFHNLALLDNGTVVAWGRNGDGQATVPVGLTDVVAIAAGGYHSVAVKADGSVVAWGFNGNDLPNSTNLPIATVPLGITDAVDVAAGTFHTLILKADGSVTGWGLNTSGQINIPAGLSGVIDLAANGNISMALKSDGTVAAWGANESGQTNVPVALTDASTANVREIALGGQHAAALLNNGSIVSWGRGVEGQVSGTSGKSNVSDISAGSNFTMMLIGNSTVETTTSLQLVNSLVPEELGGDLVVPSTPTNLTLIETKDTGAEISWTASTDNVAVTGYRIFVNGTVVRTVPANVTQTTIFGLSAADANVIRVAAIDARGNVSGQSASVTVTVTDKIAPSTPGNLAVNILRPNSFQLNWNASTDNVGVTRYNVYRNGALIATVTGRSYRFFGLTEVTSYQLGVIALDAAGNRSQMATINGTTLDGTPPTAPTSVISQGVTKNRILFGWSGATDNVAVTRYNIYLNGVYAKTVTATQSEFLNLDPSTAYSVSIQAVDAAGNRSPLSSALSLTTLDGIAPTIPSGLTTSQITKTGFRVSWNASTDNGTVTKYNVYRNGAYVQTVTGTSYTFSGLAFNLSHNITVLAIDNAGNRSELSNPLNVSTTFTPDPTPPTAPSNLASSNVSKTGFRVSWTAATDNVLVTSYNIYRNGNYIATVSRLSTAYTFAGLTAGTTYSITVRAIDAESNFTNSAPLSVTTLP